jgi:hypothetical protein
MIPLQPHTTLIQLTHTLCGSHTWDPHACNPHNVRGVVWKIGIIPLSLKQFKCRTKNFSPFLLQQFLCEQVKKRHFYHFVNEKAKPSVKFYFFRHDSAMSVFKISLEHNFGKTFGICSISLTVYFHMQGKILKTILTMIKLPLIRLSQAYMILHQTTSTNMIT